MKIFIGYEWREAEAYRVCEHSLRRHSSTPLDIKPLSAAHPYYNRTFYWKGNQRYDAADNRPFSTDFSFARFLVPIIQGYEGWAMFVDCDFLFRSDVNELFALADEQYAAQLVAHRHIPKEEIKMDGVEQTQYRGKNWSSMVLWNCGHKGHQPRMSRGVLSDGVTGETVNTYPGSWLHGFEWLKWKEIGELPEEWNHLVGYSEGANPRAVHFTEGGPWLRQYRDVDYADEWIAERDMMELEIEK